MPGNIRPTLACTFTRHARLCGQTCIAAVQRLHPRSSHECADCETSTLHAMHMSVSVICQTQRHAKRPLDGHVRYTTRNRDARRGPAFCGVTPSAPLAPGLICCRSPIALARRERYRGRPIPPGSRLHGALRCRPSWRARCCMCAARRKSQGKQL